MAVYKYWVGGLIKAGIYGYVAPRAVFPSLVCRPLYARHFGLSGPDGQLQWHVQNWFFCTSRCVARGVQENWIIWEMACIFLRHLVSGSHLFVRLPEEYKEMTPGMVLVFSTLLGSTADTCSASVYKAFFEEFTLSFVQGGLSDPEVDPRPSDCKLWSLRSCSPSLSSTSLSWRRGRFPCR